MKICIFHVTATFKVGGSETYVWRLARSLGERGHVCHLWAGAVSEPYIGDPAVVLRTARFTARKKIWKLGGRFQKLGERISFGWHARRELVREKYDLINIHKPYDLPLALWLRWRTGCRVVWRCHGKDFFPGLRWLVRRADAIFAVSEFARASLVATFPVSVSVIHTGVDTGFFEPAGERPRTPTPQILFFGRLEGWKGVKHLLAALGQLPEKNWEAKIIGDGPQEKILKEQAASLGLEGRVQFQPALKQRAEVRQELAAADIVVFPSVADETFSNALLEAMSMGCAVVATNIGGFPEVVVSGENGLLVPARDAAALAGALGNLLADAPLCEKLGRSARARMVESFDATASFGRVESLFAGLVKKTDG